MGGEEARELGQHEQMPGTCAGHPFLMGKIDDLAVDMKKGFERLGQKIEDVRVEQARTNSSLESAWHEIKMSRAKIDDYPRDIERAVHNHARGCPINDVTEVGIKSDRRKGGDRGRQESYDTPQHTQRPSLGASKIILGAPRWAVGLGSGIVLAIVLVGVFLGVFVSTCDSNKASHTVRGLANQAVPYGINKNETGESLEAATTATKEYETWQP